jgi:hypothetical protein
VVEQTAHRAVCLVCCEDLNNFNNSTIQTAIIIPSHVLPRSKANAASLGSIVINYVACEFISHKQVQTKAETNTTIIPIDHHTIPAPKRMQFAAAPITIGQKTDKNNPFHGKFGVANID